MTNFKPSQRKHYKVQKGRLSGVHTRNDYIAHGLYGLVTQEKGYIHEYHLETLRIVLTRAVRGLGKYWLPVFPQHAVTRKPLGVRMGKGKGSISHWVCRVRPGIQLAGLYGLSPELALPLLRSLGKKMPMRCVVVTKYANLFASDKSLSTNVLPSSKVSGYSRQHQKFFSRRSFSSFSTQVAKKKLLTTKKHLNITKVSKIKKVLTNRVVLNYQNSNLQINMFKTLKQGMLPWLKNYLNLSGKDLNLFDNCWSDRWANSVVTGTEKSSPTLKKQRLNLKYYFKQSIRKNIPFKEQQKIVRFFLRWGALKAFSSKYFYAALAFDKSASLLSTLTLLVPWKLLVSCPKRYSIFRLWLDQMLLLTYSQLKQVFVYLSGKNTLKTLVSLKHLIQHWTSNKTIYSDAKIKPVLTALLNKSPTVIKALFKSGDTLKVTSCGVNNSKCLAPLERLYLQNALSPAFHRTKTKNFRLLLPNRFRQSLPMQYINVLCNMQILSFKFLPLNLQQFWKFSASSGADSSKLVTSTSKTCQKLRFRSFDQHLNYKYTQDTLLFQMPLFNVPYAARIIAYEEEEEEFVISLTSKYCGTIPFKEFKKLFPTVKPWSLLNRFCLVTLRAYSHSTSVLSRVNSLGLTLSKNYLKIRDTSTSEKTNSSNINQKSQASVLLNQLARYSKGALGLASQNKEPMLLNTTGQKLELILLNSGVECSHFYKRYLIEQVL